MTRLGLGALLVAVTGAVLVATTSCGGAIAGSGIPATTTLRPTTTPQPATDSVLGIWKGTYLCGQGLTGMTLDISPTPGSDSVVDANFDFYAVPGNPNVASGSGTLAGTYASGRLTLTWQNFTINPAGYIGIDFNGALADSGTTQTLSGTVTTLPGGEGCSTFSLTRPDSAVNK